MSAEINCLCPVCLRPEEGLGYWPPDRKTKPDRMRPVMVCMADIEHARTIFQMTAETLTRLEHAALRAGGDLAGTYLDQLGKTDLTTLNEVEWVAFLEHVLTGYGEKMREQLKVHAAPF